VPFAALALLLGLALACAAGGCKDKPPAHRQVTKTGLSPTEPAPAPVPAATDLPEARATGTPAAEAPKESDEAAGYRPQAQRDPFQSFVATRAPVAVSSAQTPDIKTPLQRYSLDQLKVVGIISGGQIRKALLEDDVGKGYVVSAGDAVGSEGGRITAIQKDRIIIESTYRDVLGNQKLRQVTKKLYVSEEGENP
jgi:type IV pilus assembly protein PilP